MPDSERYVTLGRVVESACSQAVKAWVQEHARGRDPEVFLTSELREVSTTFTVGRSGYFAVWVSITARRDFDSDDYGFRALKLSPRAFLPTLLRIA